MGDECIKVAVRCRPLRPFEVERGASDNVFTKAGNEAVLLDPNANNPKPRRFAFDYVYDGKSTQEQVYEDNVTPLLEKAFAGFNATVFGKQSNMFFEFQWNANAVLLYV